MPARDNPFEFLGPLAKPLPGRRAAPRIAREAARKAAFQALSRNNLLAVYSPPQAGLTTFLLEMESWARPLAFVDVLGLDRSENESEVLLAAARRALMRAGVAPSDKAPTLTDLLLSLSPDGPLATLVLDGIDSLSKPEARRALLALRAAYTESRTSPRPPAFRIVLGSHSDLRELTAAGRTSPLNVARELFLDDFAADQVSALLAEGLGARAEGVEGLADREALARWAGWTHYLGGGQPYLTQVCGSLVFDRLYDAADGSGTAPDPDAMIGEVEETAKEHLSALATEANRIPGLPETLDAVLRGDAVTYDRIDRRIKALEFLGLIARNADGTCAIKGELYRRVLARTLTVASSAIGGSTDVHPSPVKAARESGEAAGPAPAGEPPAEAGAELRCPVCNKALSPDDGADDDEWIVCPACGHVLIRPEEGDRDTTAVRFPGPKVGDVIGGCRVLKELGHGGMSQVFLARHLDMDRLVALKVVTCATRQDLRTVRRFLREARSAARVDHENVVPVYNVGRDRDYYYLSMQYLEGGSLGARLKRADRPGPAECVRIMIEAARGLGAAHAHRIIHRDVKPDNILFSATGMAKVADFGLAAVLGSRKRLTQHGMVVGTPHYMSPEQCGGDPVDARSDLYSLGATIFHALTGSELFTGESPMAVMLKHRSEPPLPPHALNPKVPRALSEIILRTLQKNPSDRYQNVEALIAVLQELPKDL